MKSELILKVKPFSINKAYYTRKKVLTSLAREYRADFLLQLMDESNQKGINRIQTYFNKDKHFLKVSYTFFQPDEKLFTKSGYVSRKSMDLDNCLKLPTDFLCNEKYVGRIINGIEINNLNIDDQFICEIHAKKRISHDNSYSLVISVEVCDLIELR